MGCTKHTWYQARVDEMEDGVYDTGTLPDSGPTNNGGYLEVNTEEGASA